MSREIKFRSWVKDTKKFMYFHDTPTMEQFTGLCDGDGKEIFEGDLLSYWIRWVELGEAELHTGEVFWDKESCSFLIDRYFQLNFQEILSCKIIGNIKENSIEKI